MPTSDDPKPRRRALLLVGGVRDAAMQMGVAHALLVTRSAPPDYIVGVSAGAVNAAAIAEILQAGPPDKAPPDREPYQVDKLRAFIDMYAELPRTVIASLLPDSLEVLARDPLDPLELPIHFDSEREAREVANEAKAGLVRLLNDVFGVKLSIGTATRMTRRILGRIAAADLPSRPRRLWSRIANEAGLLGLFWMHYRETAPLVAKIGRAYIIGPNHTVLRMRRAGTADRLMKRVERTWNPIRLSLEGLLTIQLFGAATVGWVASIVTRAIGLLIPPGEGKGRFSAIRNWLLTPWRWVAEAFQPPFQRILGYYGLADGIANTDALKQLFVHCFDQSYYGRTKMTGVLNRSLDHNNLPAKATDLYRKRLHDYQTHTPPIHVAPVATALNEGKIRVLRKEVPVVDALLAATAVVPFFPAVRIDEEHEVSRAEASWAQKARDDFEEEKREDRWKSETEKERRAREGGEIPEPVVTDDNDELEVDADAAAEGEWFINGGNLSSEAIGPLMNYVREVLPEDDESAGLDVYRVSALPISSSPLRVDDELDGVLDVVPRALQLKQFRDATVEQQLTHLYSRALPPGKVIWRHPKTNEAFVNATVYPLELENASDLESRLLAGEKVEYRELLYETIADGCRATVEAAMPSLIRTSANGDKDVECKRIIDVRRDGVPRLPGGKPEIGPGIAEVCSRCALNRNKKDATERKAAALRVPKDRGHWPDWPIADPKTPVEMQPAPPDGPRTIELGEWPQKRDNIEGKDRPLVSLLFGGGVFRGVFHMGVMTALNELGMYPDVVAGSSVGSIIAAMIAQVFSNPVSRQREMAHLAATFLSIDRLILTDRFADFVRRLTLHAADTRFSPYDLDLLFRRYDADGNANFSRRSRTVSAGIERLVNVSPFELFELARDLRLSRFSDFLREAKLDVQGFLDHSGVPKEILGSEPLALLIHNHVLSGRRAADPRRDDVFESFRDRGIYFLATATNLNSGELEILGENTLSSDKEPSLLYGLLASSAFPAVFRPRQSWEIFRRAIHRHQYIDGGVIDNLPLHAVARFLDRASRHCSSPIARRPKPNGQSVPHLIFTASLEVDPAVRSDVDALVRDCIQLWRHSQTLKYNRKIDAFAKTQRDLRSIYEERLVSAPSLDSAVDLHVMAVKPKWLCSTFGFHPMLGFRRRKQAQSIAHGCASTLAAVYQFTIEANGRKDRAAWLKAWGANRGTDFDPDCFHFVEAGKGKATDGMCELQPARRRKPGTCWFRTASPCPYSEDALKNAGVAEQKRSEIRRIYEFCGQASTHQSKGNG